MTMKVMTPAGTSAKQMRAVVFSALQSGQRAKHENELRKLGFEVDTRDFPRTYNLDAYEVVIVVKDHAFDSDKANAEAAAKKAGKPWFRITKKTSNPTWDAIRDWAVRQGLTPIPDGNSHEASFTGRSFASAFTEHLAKRADAGDWEDLAREYELQAQTCATQTKEALAKYEAAEAELKEVRKRLQQAVEDANATAAQREAVRRDLVLAQGEVARLRDSVSALGSARDTAQSNVRRLQDELKTARQELQNLRDNGSSDESLEAELEVLHLTLEEMTKKFKSSDEMLRRARKERDERTDLVRGLQDEIERLNRAIRDSSSKSGAVPAGKKLVPANIVATVERLWALVGDGVLEPDEAVEKIVAQLKGD
jgi:hypothetical protein